MSDIADQNRPSPLYWREVSNQRSDLPLLWYLEALSKQGCVSKTDGVLGHKRAGNNCRGCDHGNE